ncbi:MAG: tetratricopeptide repeat protein [Pseudolabrys sp.]
MASSPEAIFQRGLTSLNTGKLEDAERQFKTLLQRMPGHVASLNLLAVVLSQRKKFSESELYLKSALSIDATRDATFNNYGLVLKALKRPAEAFDRFSQALAIDGRNAVTWNHRGTTLNDLKRFEEAVADFDKAISFDAKFADAYCNKGNSLSHLKRFDEAFTAYDKALALNPQLASAWFGRGNALHGIKKFDEALSAYDKASAINPSFIEPLVARGNIYSGTDRYEKAAAAFDKALAIDPGNPSAWLGRGNVLTALLRLDDAGAAYNNALKGNPDLAEAWFGRGRILASRNRLDLAQAAYEKAVSLKPDLVLAWFGRGNIFYDRKQFDEAAFAFEKAYTLDPELNFLEGYRLNARMYLGEWAHYDDDVAHLLKNVRAGKPASTPFALLPIPASAADHSLCVQNYVKNWPCLEPVRRNAFYSHDRIRVAYLSSDFRVHPIAYAVAELFELHDRKKFEVIGISFRPDEKSGMRARIARSFDQFHDVQPLKDQQAAEFIAQLEIDIAVDLNNYSAYCRPGILARRPAPIQVNYLGHALTMGVDFMDYAIADKFVLPDDQHKFWTEKIVQMPDTSMVQDTVTKRAMPTQPPTRGAAGLPEDAFVFCCFNNSFKITPPVFQVWMRLLKAIDGSVVWLSPTSDIARQNLCNEASKAGVDPSRLIFAPLTERVEDHLSRHRAADLFLDTLPYNAHSTAADALWAGLPVVTCAGETFVARVAGSLLHAIGVPELITESLEAYEALALALARDPQRLAELKAKLARNRDSYPLFDTARFTRNLEAAYVTMWQKYQRGEPPASFEVKALS